jgi:ferric-dicitrate binding protein FerR (iron transport regulator)
MFGLSCERWTKYALLLAVSGLVFLPRLEAQPRLGSMRPAAKVIAETGQVSVLKDGYPLILNVCDSIQVQQTVVTGPDSYVRFQLEDNTVWEVFANSRVVFHQNYPSWVDWLYVQIGRVKIFEQHTKGEDSKKVTTPTAVISVRGTTYDVVVEDDDGTTFVTVDEGAVWVRNHTAPGDGVLLNPGESVRVFRGQPLQQPKIARADAFRVVLKAVQNAMYQVVYGRTGSPASLPGGGGGAPAGGSPGDKKGSSGGGTGTGTTNGAPIPGGGH